MSDSPLLTERSLLLTRWGQLKSERSSWWAHWQEISSYVLPRNGRFFIQDRNKGMRRHNNIYDSTGTRSLRILAAGMMAGMTSPARPWFRLGTSDPDLAKSASVKQWMADVTRLMLTVFQKSNTYRALHTHYEELGAFGTATGLVLEDFDNVIHHYPLTTGEYAIATNWKGEVTTLYREFQKTVVELVGEFGIDNVSDTVKSMYNAGTLDQWVTIIHAIEPRIDRDPRKRDSKNMAWKSVYFELNGREGKPLRESGYKRFPALAARWGVSGGDVYGNSPGMEALGDIKQLQHEQLRKAEAIDYKTKPPLQVPTALKNREVEMLPGGITFYDAAQPQGGIRSMFDVNLDLSHLLNDIQDVRQRVREAFSADMFLMLANQTDTRMTATEVAERHEEKMLMLGPTVERLHNELLNPLVEATFARLLEAGVLPAPPPELHGQALNVEYISMLAQAQRAIATNGVDRFVGNLGQIAAFAPGVLDKFDSDAWADRYADMLGIDPELVVADDKVALIRNQRAQQQEAAQKAAMANSAADTAQKLGNTPTNTNNALSALVSGGGLVKTGPSQDVGRAFSGYN